MMDKLEITGVASRFDGVYEFDLVDLLSVSSPDALTVDEARAVKRMSGARGNEVGEAFLAGDVDVRLALAVIVLARNGKTLDPRMVGDKPIGWARFVLAPDDPADESEGDADPPTVESVTPIRQNASGKTG